MLKSSKVQEVACDSTQSPTGWLRRAVATFAAVGAVGAVGAVAQQRHRAWQRPGGWEMVPAVDLEQQIQFMGH